MKNLSKFISQTNQDNKPLKRIPQSLSKTLLCSLKPQVGTKSIRNFVRKSFKTQQNYDQDSQKQKVKLTLTHDGKLQRKFYPSTYRPQLTKVISNSSQVLLVHLLYKQKNISIFLDKGVTFEQLIKRMYKEIYIFEKQSYSSSNVILKNLMYKITGFQSFDNDLLFDYQLKYKRGTLNKQRFFVPFKQEDVKMPFKLFTVISQLPYEGHQFLARNFSDGNWSIIKTIKKNSLDEQKVLQIKKSLKNHFNACTLLLKYSPSYFSQINWFETKHYLISVSEFFPENLEENLKANKNNYKQRQIQQIFVFFSIWLAEVFKQLVNLNINNFQGMSLKTIVLNPDGYPMVSVLQNVHNYLQIMEKNTSNLHNGKKNNQKIQDNFYFETYFNLLSEMKSLFGELTESNSIFEEFLNFLNKQSIESKFSFRSVLKYYQQNNLELTTGLSEKQVEKAPLEVDFTSKFQQIVQTYQNSKNNYVFAGQQTALFAQIKQEIHEAYNIQNWRKNHPRNQTYSDVKIPLPTYGFLDLKKQNIGNLLEFKKQEQRKSNIKTDERSYIHEIINEMNKNQNFIKTTKKNNISSIGFYLQKSDEKLKKKITQKIENKYKKFLFKKQNPSNEQILREMRNSSLKNQTFYSKKGCFSQSKSNQNFSFIKQNRKLTSLSKRKHPKNLLTMTSEINGPFQSQSKQNVSGFNSTILGKQSLIDQSCYGSLERDSICKTTMSFSKSKLFDTFSPLLNTKRQKLQGVFVNKKDFTKKDKVMLKKKHYGIYLEQAEKQYNKIKALKNSSIIYPLK